VGGLIVGSSQFSLLPQLLLKTTLTSKVVKSDSKTGVGNYFRPRATLGFYLCLAGQIQVKYAYSKLKLETPRAVCCPLLL